MKLSSRSRGSKQLSAVAVVANELTDGRAFLPALVWPGTFNPTGVAADTKRKSFVPVRDKPSHHALLADKNRGRR